MSFLIVAVINLHSMSRGLTYFSLNLLYVKNTYKKLLH